MDSTYLSAGHYLSKSQAARYLCIPSGTLQYHIIQGHIKTIKIEGMGHLINKKDIIEFKEKLKEMKPGKPSIYKKYCERCDKLGFDKCLCRVGNNE